MDLKIASLRQTLNHRTTSLKLRPLPQARAFAASYNADSVGELVEDFNDPFRVEWDLDGKSHGDVVVGSEVSRPDLFLWTRSTVFSLSILLAGKIRPAKKELPEADAFVLVLLSSPSFVVTGLQALDFDLGRPSTLVR